MMFWIKIKIQMADNYINLIFKVKATQKCHFCVLQENSIAKLTTEYGL